MMLDLGYVKVQGKEDSSEEYWEAPATY